MSASSKGIALLSITTAVGFKGLRNMGNISCIFSELNKVRKDVTYFGVLKHVIAIII
jgi:hypothetical protein